MDIVLNLRCVGNVYTTLNVGKRKILLFIPRYTFLPSILSNVLINNKLHQRLIH